MPPVRPATRTLLLHGGAGQVEVLLDEPASAPQGLVLVAHPQPLLGGSALHKVPQVLARGLQEAGWLAVRPNFRGVGASAGQYDAGHGETEDLLQLLGQLRRDPGLPLALVGFSFGAFVQTRVARRLADSGSPPASVALAGLPVGEVLGGRTYAPAAPVPRTLVIHGELDERVPLVNVLAWGERMSQPVVVVPDAGHAFSGRLPALRAAVVGHLRQCLRPPTTPGAPG